MFLESCALSITLHGTHAVEMIKNHLLEFLFWVDNDSAYLCLLFLFIYFLSLVW